MALTQGDVESVAAALSHRYDDFQHFNRRDPLEELVFIFCSTQTDEKKYLATFERLLAAFPSIEDLGVAAEEDLERILRPAGLAPMKARLLRRTFDQILSEHGTLTLDPLKFKEDRDCEAFLTALPGVGKKVARCVMMYSLGRHVFPVDSHCWRISRRLGWVRATRRDKRCTDRDMDRLQAKVPSHLRFSLHVNMVSLGRELCRPESPACPRCPIRAFCRRGRSSIGNTPEDRQRRFQ